VRGGEASGAIAGCSALIMLYPFGNVFVFFWIIIFRVIAVPAITP
jgi:hypothetical protein